MMQEDIFPAAEKILSDIENVLRKDPNLIGFEIIPALHNENKSPVIHAENSLGLASWSVKPLYRYAYSRLIELRENKQRREDPSTVSRWLLGALLLNPDVGTFWNMRRELVRNGRLEPMGELRFVTVVLYYKAKCFEAFAYRRWLLRFILLGKNQSLDVEATLQSELIVTTMSANRYANNYHAWSHREHIVACFEAFSRMTLGSFLRTEWVDSEKWCSLHISDYSGFAYRQFLLKRLLLYREDHRDLDLETTTRGVVSKFTSTGMLDSILSPTDKTSSEMLDWLHDAAGEKQSEVECSWMLTGLSYWMEECMFNEELLNLYPGHEALWYHRRFLVYILVVLTASYKQYSSYKAETFHRCARFVITDNEGKNLGEVPARSPLEVFFQKHNRDVVQNANTVGGHQAVMAERFLKFLASLRLGL